MDHLRSGVQDQPGQKKKKKNTLRCQVTGFNNFMNYITDILKRKMFLKIEACIIKNYIYNNINIGEYIYSCTHHSQIVR